LTLISKDAEVVSSQDRIAYFFNLNHFVDRVSHQVILNPLSLKDLNVTSEVVAQALGVVWHNLLLKVLLEHLSPFFAEKRLEQKLGVLLS
jgi:hypothetical protein